MVLLDRGEDEILRAIESGAIGWAWDIASEGAVRREIRVWRDSLLALIQGKREGDLSEEKVLATVLPPRDVRSPELQRLFSCSSTHVHSLIDAALIRPSAEPRATSGRNAYTVVDRASVAAFLRSRRIL